jgi:hypothetical protein
MDPDSLFNLAFFGGMATMWVLQRGVNSWRAHRRRRREAKAELPGQEEARAEEIRALHERLAVLERIATDPAERTAREIEALR